jgi:HK97 family phage portal protein
MEPRGGRKFQFDSGGSHRNFLWDNDSGRFLAAVQSNPSGVKVDADEVLRSTVYLACLRVIGETLANLPLRIMQKTSEGERVAEEHWLHRLFFHGPNSWQTTWEWVTQKVIHLGTCGQAMDEKVYSTDSEIGMEPPRVMALIPLHPTKMKCDRLESGRLGYIFTDENGHRQPFRQEQVTHFRWLTNDGINGIVPHEVSEDAIGLARACEIHGAAYFGNGARPGVVLSTDSDELSNEARDEIRYAWEKVHRGPSRAHRPAVLTGGLKPIPFEGNNSDSQFLETRKFQAEEICRIMGVPPHLVGMLDRSTNNNIEQQGLDFLTYTMMAWTRRFETTICRDLLTYQDREGGFYPEFDTTALMRGDAAGRSAYYHSGLQDGWLCVNEVRTAEGKNRVPGGDQRFVQLNMQTLEQAATSAAASAAKAASANAIVPATSRPSAPPAPGQQSNGAPVADVSLNVAQISGMIEILGQVSVGLLTTDAAKAFVAAAFPSLPGQTIERILAGTSTTPVSPPAAQSLPSPGGQ